MSSRALVAAYLGAIVSLASPVPLAGEPPPLPTSAGHSLRKGALMAISDAPAARQRPATDVAAAIPGEPEVEGPLATSATLVNVHSGEALALDESTPSDERFSRLMPDRTSGELHGFDARLLGVIRRVAARHPGARIELVSGYRSPKFNEHLRKKGHRVASHSQHSRGHAIDFRVEGLSPAEIVAELRALRWSGGIGRYDSVGDRFVHVDVGRERFWMGH
ncbi:MAG: DUF882 domain-containing protein [Polyangiaceae bacterium]|jgi:uncharacterized protein YcbK (DUF882 family)|nr:DUF882 domain-containing protein [Polyangiaceae bacterium]